MVSCRSFLIAYLFGRSWGYHTITRNDLVRAAAAQQDSTEEEHSSSLLQLFSAEEEPHVLRPKELAPGEIVPLVRRDTQQLVDQETSLIGLPPELAHVFQDYVQESGIVRVVDQLLYSRPITETEEGLIQMKDGTTWIVRTSNNWNSQGDMIWIDPGDEWTYEVMLSFFRKAGFDTILETLGDTYGSQSLSLIRSSFIAISQFNGTNIHTDNDDLDGSFYNVLFPIVIPTSGGMLQVADRETWHDVGIQFRYDQGVVLGAISPHGTGKANYRPERQFRMAVSTYIADINEDTAEYLDEDTASFPPSYMPYYLSQMERHWKRNDHTVSLQQDKGRRPFVL